MLKTGWPPGIESDSFGFLMAMQEYDLSKFQPNFPGYPIYILSGKLFTFIFNDSAAGLQCLNYLFTALLVIPFYLIACKFFSKLESVFLSACLFFSPLIFSTFFKVSPEPMASFFLLLSYYYLLVILYRESKKNMVLSGLFLGLAVCTKPDFFPFLFSVVLIKIFFKTRILLLFVTVFLVVILSVTGQLIITGLPEYLHNAYAFTTGHFTKWGGTILTNYNIFTRIYDFIIDGLIYKGFGLGSFTAGIGITAGIIMSFFPLSKFHTNNNLIYKISFLFSFPYMLWVFFAQNLNSPRHLYPLIPFVLLYSYKGFNDMLRLIFKCSTKLFVLGKPLHRQFMGDLQYRAVFSFALTSFSTIFLSLFFIFPSIYIPSSQVQAASYFRDLPDKNNIFFSSWSGKVFEYIAPEYLTIHPDEVNVKDMAQEAINQGYTCYITSLDLKYADKFGLKKVKSFYREPLLQDAYPAIDIYKMYINNI